MDTTEESIGQKKTYRVLNSILAGNTNLGQIEAATNLSRREINALIYALEKQGRVVAANYDMRRCFQQFRVLRYEADATKGFPRIHPGVLRAAKLKEEKASMRMSELHAAFFGFAGMAQRSQPSTSWANQAASA